MAALLTGGGPVREPVELHTPRLFTMLDNQSAGRRSSLRVGFGDVAWRALAALLLRPGYLHGTSRLLLGRKTQTSRGARWHIEELADTTTTSCDLDVLGILLVNPNGCSPSPPLACPRGPWVSVIAWRDEREGTVHATWTVEGMDSAGEMPERTILSERLFDDFVLDEITVRVWRLVWRDLRDATAKHADREVAGFLAGKIHGGDRIIEVNDATMTACGGAMGVSLRPSQAPDRSALAVKNELDAQLKDRGHVEVVGWWHTHPTQGILMSEADRQTHRTLFPRMLDDSPESVRTERWRLSAAFVLAPHPDAPESVRCGVFVPVVAGNHPSIGERLAALPALDSTLDWALDMVDPPTARPSGRTALLEGLVSPVGRDQRYFPAPRRPQASPARSPRRWARRVAIAAGLIVVAALALVRSPRLTETVVDRISDVVRSLGKISSQETAP